MANQYVNKVELADGTSLIDISSDTVTSGSMLSGVTAHDKSGASVTGNIASKTSSDLTASTLTVTAPAGYYASNATKTLTDANLSAGNIKKDVTIFGVTGSYEGGGGGTTTIIVPEQTITASSAYNQITFSAPLVAGEEYKYTINGNTATGTASSQYGSIILGLYANGYVFDYSSPNMYFDVFDSSLYGTYTVKVWQESGGGGGSTLIEKSITANGVYNASDDDADGYSKVTVNVSGGGLVYETGTYTPTNDIAKPTISFANTHTTMPMFIMMADAVGNYSATTYTNLGYWYTYNARVFGQPFYQTSSDVATYGYVYYRYRGSSAGSSNATQTSLSYPDSSTQSGSAPYPRYHTTESAFYPSSNSSSRYWKSGRTYKWIAVWAPTT